MAGPDHTAINWYMVIIGEVQKPRAYLMTRPAMFRPRSATASTAALRRELRGDPPRDPPLSPLKLSRCPALLGGSRLDSLGVEGAKGGCWVPPGVLPLAWAEANVSTGVAACVCRTLQARLDVIHGMRGGWWPDLHGLAPHADAARSILHAAFGRSGL